VHQGAGGYRKKTGKRIYSIGAPWAWIPRLVYSFLTYMDAYNVKVVDDEGKLRSTDRGAQGLIAAVKDYAHTIERAARRLRRELEGSGQQRRLPQQGRS